MKKEIEKIAKQILVYEYQCQQGIEIDKNMTLIQELISGLSFEQILEIDNYIQEKILTK